VLIHNSNAVDVATMSFNPTEIPFDAQLRPVLLIRSKSAMALEICTIFFWMPFSIRGRKAC
jgi:hypothetical protein